MQFFTNLEPCLIGMEACGSSHYRARELSKLGHDVRLIPANYVKPYVKRGKSDANDAEAICEAVTRPTMRFAAIKSAEQQAVLFLHRARDLIVRQRTKLSNMLRSLLAEFGVIIQQGTGAAVKYAKDVLEGEKPAIPEFAIDVLSQFSHQLVAMRFRWHEMRMRLHSKLGKRVMLLRTIPGVGPVTASAIVATVGDAKQFVHSTVFQHVGGQQCWTLLAFAAIAPPIDIKIPTCHHRCMKIFVQNSGRQDQNRITFPV
ncbi:IS110 family transposase [Celeribacter sp.]|uniref:IS110 family transposase n=1 Tax=Celeribacter sp. TaxID=1890673 RepID=UPI003A934FF8